MRSWTAIGQKFDGAHAGICGAIANGLNGAGPWIEKVIFRQAEFISERK